MSLGSEATRSEALETIEAVAARETEADDVLRGSVGALAEQLEARWVAIAFVEDGRLQIGPAAGDLPDPPAAPAVSEPVLYDGAEVAEIWIGADSPVDDADREFLTRAALLLSPYCLVGWDTGGQAWEV
jgi:hypothetical protein